MCERHPLAVAGPDRKGEAAIVARPFEGRPAGRRRCAAGVDLDAIELVLGAAIASIGLDRAKRVLLLNWVGSDFYASGPGRPQLRERVIVRIDQQPHLPAYLRPPARVDAVQSRFADVGVLVRRDEILPHFEIGDP